MLAKKSILLLLLLILYGCKVNDTLMVKESIVIEYGQQLKPAEMVISGKYDSLAVEGYDPLNTDSQEVELFVKTKSKTQVYHVTVTVEDTAAPIFKKQTDSINLNQNETLDLSKYFIAEDPIDGQVDVTLDTQLDTSISGEHSRYVVAVDKNGNKAQLLLNIKIKATEQVSSNQTNNVSQGSTSNNNVNSNNNTPVPVQPPAPSVNPSAFNKNYMFDEGYDMNTALEACSNELNNISRQYNLGGSCNPIKNGNIYIGYSLIFY